MTAPKKFRHTLLLLPIAALAALTLQGCIEMAAVGIGAAALSANDRRSTGAQVDDEGIELRSTNRVSERFGRCGGQSGAG